MKQIKAGTRCECRDRKNGSHSPLACPRDAVRLVMVRDKDGNIHPACVTASGPHFVTGIVGIPMCAPCAAHAEGGAK